MSILLVRYSGGVILRAIKRTLLNNSCNARKVKINDISMLFRRSDFVMARHSVVFVSYSDTPKVVTNNEEFWSYSKESKKGFNTSDQQGLEPPSNLCCMSGCANCVWMTYADNLIKHYAEKRLTINMQKLLNEIEENIDDPMIKAFIKLEIKSKLM